MLDFKVCRDPETKKLFLKTSSCGKNLLTTPQLNKGTAFTREERVMFDLLGKLPHMVETLEEQVERAYLQYSNYKTPLQRNIYLNNLHDKNQILFYSLLNRHLTEMLPVIYTPTVSQAVVHFSREYRQPRGLYITHFDKDNLDAIISNRSNPDIDLIVVTDGEGVLGIGDQGIGGMEIPVAKLMVYSLCGGIDPTRTLPIFLDVGTNNEALLADPMYLGCRHKRIDSVHYNAFIDQFVDRVQAHFPNAFLHWEDLGRDNARPLLDRYQDQLCTFNDDIQGTGAVTLAALLAASDLTNTALHNHRIFIYGAGSAGTGVGDQIIDALIMNGIAPKDAYACFWLFDKQGLLIEGDQSLTDAQKPYARPKSEADYPSLITAIERIKPTVLIGCSAQAGAFSQAVIECMARHCQRPIVFPLSNPDEKCEAKPADVLAWTNGQAIIATGTAFEPIECNHHLIHIAQCNNALIFPGIGLGVQAIKARRLSKAMILAAARALSELSPSKQNPYGPILPLLNEAQTVAQRVATAVAQTAIETGLAQHHPDCDIATWISSIFWQPQYLPFQRSRS